MAMSNNSRREVSAADDRAAVVVDARDALNDIAALLATLDSRGVWRAIAWEPDTAAADARRAVRRVERALALAQQQAHAARVQAAG